jgi:hypothetical protein
VELKIEAESARSKPGFNGRWFAAGRVGNDSFEMGCVSVPVVSPSLPDAGGRRGFGERRNVFFGLPLSPALSPLVPHGEREKKSHLKPR